MVVGWFGGRLAAGESASEDLEGTGAALFGVVLLAIGLTLLGYGLGLLIRNTAASICVLLLWPLIAEGLIAALLVGHRRQRTRRSGCRTRPASRWPSSTSATKTSSAG